MEATKMKEYTKLLVGCIPAATTARENQCMLQSERLLMTYDRFMHAAVPHESKYKFVVDGKKLRKFFTPKSVEEYQIIEEKTEVGTVQSVTFQSNDKKMSLYSIAGKDAMTLISGTYDEALTVPHVEIDEKLQKEFIKTLKQSYVTSNVDDGGVFLSKNGIMSIGLGTYIFQGLNLPLDTVIHIPFYVLDRVFKIKEPIIKIGINAKTKEVYFFGESGIVYMCHTTKLTEEEITKQLSHWKFYEDSYAQDRLTVTAETFDVLQQASVGTDELQPVVNIQIKGSNGKISSKSLEATFVSDFTWDETASWDLDIGVSYPALMKYVKEGSSIKFMPNGEDIYLCVCNERQLVIISTTN